jgi:hypothetical protein
METTQIKWKDNLTGEDVVENLDAVTKRMRPKKIKDNDDNGRAILNWLIAHKTTPTGVDGSEAALEQAIAGLHYAGKIQWDVAPRTLSDDKKDEKPFKTLNLAELTRDRIDDERAANVMAVLRNIANSGNYGRHSTNERVRAGLTTFLNAWTKQNPRPTFKAANAFEVEFRKEEARLLETR